MIDLFGRLVRRFIQSIGIPTLLRLTLLTLTLVSVERGLVAILGHINPQWLVSTVVFGVLTGWLLGRSRLPGWGSGLAALGIGVVWLILSVGQMSAPLDELLAALPPILKMFIFRLPPEFGPLLDAWTGLIRSFGALSNRLMLWIHNAGTSTLIVDPGITGLVWGLALWTVSIWAAWWILKKGNLGIGLLPATALLVFNIYYTNSKFGIYWLVLTGGGWITLQALESYLKGRRRWQEQRMGQTEIEPLMAGVVLLIAIGLMLAGGLLPSVSIQKISDTFQHIFQSHRDSTLAESLGLQQTPVMVSTQGSSGIGLSVSHAIGPGPQLSQEVMAYVTIEGYVPPPPADVFLYSNIDQPDIRYYWRSQTYDMYNGHVWIANTSRTQAIAANSLYHPNLATLPANYQLVNQSVERLQPMDGALFVAGDLLSVDQLSTAAWRASDDLVDARTDADTYSAVSRIQYVTVDLLHQAGNNYPESVHNYLDLPDELPGRVRDLAVNLTIEQPTPYDKVMAIQNYLRQFPYSLKVPGAPTNRDVADYFLFELQKGYCDYYATTMAVMVRAVGIPSRLVTGFSTGTYDYNAHRFVVVQANSHSWVEVYFPGIGWVEFEPTTNQQPFPRPGGTNQAASAISVPTPVPLTGSAAIQINWSALSHPIRILEFVLAGLAILALLWLLLPLESWFLFLRPANKAITTIHHRLYRRGRAWGVAADPARTPHEFASAFAARLARFAGDQRMASVTVSLQADVNWLTILYTRLLFSPHPPTQEEHYQAVRIWARIRKGLRKIRAS
jgi:transglutaminase-like putative cysteine protease